MEKLAPQLLSETKAKREFGFFAFKELGREDLARRLIDLIEGKIGIIDLKTLETGLYEERQRYTFTAKLDQPLPNPEDLSGGGRVDFIWFIDADGKEATGQSHLGNDYNIHLST